MLSRRFPAHFSKSHPPRQSVCARPSSSGGGARVCLQPPPHLGPETLGAMSCGHLANLVAQCSATPATVAATPQCSATPFQTQISVRHFLGGVATPVLQLQNAVKSRKSAATRVARQGVPAIIVQLSWRNKSCFFF